MQMKAPRARNPNTAFSAIILLSAGYVGCRYAALSLVKRAEAEARQVAMASSGPAAATRSRTRPAVGAVPVPVTVNASVQDLDGFCPPRAPCSSRHRRQARQCHRQLGLVVGPVAKLAGKVVLVGRHVVVVVAAQVEQDDLAVPFDLAAQRLDDRAWLASGAGTIPSARANSTPASKQAVWW
jgi:hypothetical protein